MSLKTNLAMTAFLVWALVTGALAEAATITSSSCSQQDVQRALDEAADGDTVLVPPGEATWAPASVRTPAVVVSGKSVTLKGAGAGKTVITDGNPHAFHDLLLVVAGKKPFRITGFTFRALSGVRGSAAVKVSGGAKAWRIDHCAFEGTGRGVWAYDDSFGLVDNCTFVRVGQGVVMKGKGDVSWETPLSLGAQLAVYIEDCTFLNDGEGWNWAIDGYHGARYVFRHNVVSGQISLSHHGCDSGNFRSTMSFEVYGNTMQGPGTRRAMHFRGGTGVVFDNVLTGYDTGIDVANYRSDPKLRKLCGKWGICDGTNPVDGNEEPNGYPSRDQIGRSAGQTMEPLYEWANTLDGEDADVHVSTGRQHIKEGRDYFHDTQRPGYEPCPYPHPLRRTQGDG